jgi:hypothetical protein
MSSGTSRAWFAGWKISAVIVEGVAPSQSQDQVQRAAIHDVVFAQSTDVFHLLAGEDESLLTRRDPSLSWIFSFTLSSYPWEAARAVILLLPRARKMPKNSLSRACLSPSQTRRSWSFTALLRKWVSP